MEDLFDYSYPGANKEKKNTNQKEMYNITQDKNLKA